MVFDRMKALVQGSDASAALLRSPAFTASNAEASSGELQRANWNCARPQRSVSWQLERLGQPSKAPLPDPSFYWANTL